MKKIFLYCHDTLAFGHISRMLNIYHVLSSEHDVYMIFWWNIPKWHIHNLNYINLPIVDESDIYIQSKKIKKILKKRKKILQELCITHMPDILLIDYFPFGRVALKDEIEYLINTVKIKNYRSKVYTFMRDIFYASNTCVNHKEYIQVKEDIFYFFGHPYMYIVENCYNTFHLYTQKWSYQQEQFLKFIWKESLEEGIWYNLFIEYYFQNNILDGCLIFGDESMHQLSMEFHFSFKVRENFHYLWYLLPQWRDTQYKARKQEYILFSFWGAIFNYDIYMSLLEKISSLSKIPIKCVLPFFKDTEKLWEIQKNFYEKI